MSMILRCALVVVAAALQLTALNGICSELSHPQMLILPRLSRDTSTPILSSDMYTHYSQLIDTTIHALDHRHLNATNYLKTPQASTQLDNAYAEKYKYIAAVDLILRIWVEEGRKYASSKVDVYVHDSDNNFIQSFYILREAHDSTDQPKSAAELMRMSEIAAGNALAQEFSSASFQPHTSPGTRLAVVPSYYIFKEGEVKSLGASAEAHYRRVLGAANSTLRNRGFAPLATMTASYFSSFVYDSTTPYAKAFSSDIVVPVAFSVKVRKIDNGNWEATAKANRVEIYTAAGKSAVVVDNAVVHDAPVRDEAIDSAERDLGIAIGQQLAVALRQ